jgi:hypothetical protein
MTKMSTQQFEALRTIFAVARNEASNDENLGDWLINLGGSLIAMAVNLSSEEDEDEDR